MSDPKPLSPGEKPAAPIADENVPPEEKAPGERKPEHKEPPAEEGNPKYDL